MTEHNELPDQTSRRVSRRTVVKAAAWSVPAVVVATASPASAAVSGTIVIESASGNGAINLLGLTSTTFSVKFGGTSNTPHPVTLTVTGPGNRQWVQYSGNTALVEPGDVVNFTAKVRQLVAIVLSPTVTATFSDGNPPSSATARVSLLSAQVDAGETGESGTASLNSTSGSKSAPAPVESTPSTTPTPAAATTPTPAATTPAP